MSSATLAGAADLGAQVEDGARLARVEHLEVFAAERLGTILPRLSRTIAAIDTRSTLERKTAGGGSCAQAGPASATSRRRRRQTVET